MTTTPHKPARLWSCSETAEYLGVPLKTIYTWRTKRKGPPAHRIGKYLRYVPDEVEAWAAAQGDAA